ncbi:MAG: hypothetical protein ACYC7L_13290 [Nitrospirota bacterium]
MKMLMRIIVAIALVAAGFAAGFPIGRNSGFATGSEWALVHAGVLAQEAGLFMPVSMEEGQFRVVLKQPKHLYREAWLLADRYEDTMTYGSRVDEADAEGVERMQLARNTSVRQ